MMLVFAMSHNVLRLYAVAATLKLVVNIYNFPA
jgi:hypothetical protein